MILHIYNEAYPCAKAERGADYIRLYDENGACVLLCGGISDFSGYALEGGEWSAPEPAAGGDVSWEAMAQAIGEGVNDV